MTPKAARIGHARTGSRTGARRASTMTKIATTPMSRTTSTVCQGP